MDDISMDDKNYYLRRRRRAIQSSPSRSPDREIDNGEVQRRDCVGLLSENLRGEPQAAARPEQSGAARSLAQGPPRTEGSPREGEGQPIQRQERPAQEAA